MPKVQGGNMVRALQDTASGRAIFTPSYNTKDKQPHQPESPPGREDRHWPRTVTPGAERTGDGLVRPSVVCMCTSQNSVSET